MLLLFLGGGGSLRRYAMLIDVVQVAIPYHTIHMCTRSILAHMHAIGKCFHFRFIHNMYISKRNHGRAHRSLLSSLHTFPQHSPCHTLCLFSISCTMYRAHCNPLNPVRITALCNFTCTYMHCCHVLCTCTST